MSLSIGFSLWKVTLGRLLFVKRCHDNPEGEVAAHKYLRAYTAIPCPAIYFHFRYKKVHCIVMGRVPGVTLREAWAYLSSDDLDRISTKLAAMVYEIRSHESPYGSIISSASGGPFPDSYLRLFGRNLPFAYEQSLSAYILGGDTKWPDDILSAHSTLHPIVFTHGEIARRNIMVHMGMSLQSSIGRLQGGIPLIGNIVKP